MRSVLAYVVPIGRYVASTLIEGFSCMNLSKIAWSCGLPCPFDWARSLIVTVVALVDADVTETPTADAATAVTARATASIPRLPRMFLLPVTRAYLLVSCVENTSCSTPGFTPACSPASVG